MTECDFRDWVIKTNAASALLSLGSLALGEATCHVVRALKQPSGAKAS